MAFRLIGTDQFTATYVMDSEDDVSSLPTDCGAGSQAFCAPSSDGSGMGRVVYILNTDGVWEK